jgi:hypothetical protein
MTELRREDLAPDTVDLVDELLQRLHLEGEQGRVEIEFQNGRALKVWIHRPFARSELVRFDRP